MKKEIRNAKIESTMLGIEDHGLTTCYLFLDYGGAGQGFGGRHLGNKDKPQAAFGFFIRRVLEVVGVDAWEKLPGKYVRVDATAADVDGIGNIIEDKWFYPAEELKRFF